MRASAKAAAADQMVQGIELPRARPHRVQEDVRILDHFELRIDAAEFARNVYRPRECGAELSIRGTPGDDPCAERTCVVDRDFVVLASRVGLLPLRTNHRLDRLP